VSFYGQLLEHIVLSKVAASTMARPGREPRTSGPSASVLTTRAYAKSEPQ